MIAIVFYERYSNGKFDESLTFDTPIPNVIVLSKHNSNGQGNFGDYILRVWLQW